MRWGAILRCSAVRPGCFSPKKKANQLEVYNDINGNLVNLFRCVKYHCGELQRELEWMLTSREQFFDCLTQYQARGLTDIQRAARPASSMQSRSASDVITAPMPPAPSRSTTLWSI